MKLVLSVLLIISFISCNTTNGELPYRSNSRIFAEEPSITGEITHIGQKQVGEDSHLEILVEENPDVNEPLKEAGKKINFSIQNKTEFFILKKDQTYYYQKEGLKVGHIVSGWLMNGIVLTSYPQQGEAKRILVIE